MKQFTKEGLINELEKISHLGWVPSGRGKNDGAVGNTLEDLLGISENNLPLPNAAEWELKAQRAGSSSLVTLCHLEPSPRTYRFVPKVLLPHYGWPHAGAGIKYKSNERSFRMTISAARRSDRGFCVEIDHSFQRLAISFDTESIDNRHDDWRLSVEQAVGLTELNPQPYWGFEDLAHKMGSKISNCFYVNAHARKVDGKEEFWFYEAWMLSHFDFGHFLEALNNGTAFVDFDARTGHNHGTKFRIRQSQIMNLFDNRELLFSLTS